MWRPLISRPLIALAFVLLIAGGALPAHALTIAPARLELTGDPGTTIAGEFIVSNEEAGTRTFYSSAQNFEARGESGTPNFVTSAVGLSSWIDVAPEITLAEGEKLVVPFTVAIPADAEAGGNFAAIFLSTVPPASDGSQVAIGAQVGVLVLLRVSGDVAEEAGIADFGPADRVVTSLPVLFSYRFTNAGGDRVNPRGDITVRNLIGLKKVVIAANPSEGNVLPGSTRKYDVYWGDPNDARPAGFFQAALYELQNFAIGPYRATVALAYGVSGEAVETEWVFVLPWHLLVILLVILVVLFPLFRFVIRRYNRWIISKARAA